MGSSVAAGSDNAVAVGAGDHASSSSPDRLRRSGSRTAGRVRSPSAATAQGSNATGHARGKLVITR
ncbi:hypothetical protein [Streptomyces xantholiticus]|uniref:hypothetical protein n=1 Tax=Streptomyces xantholiticus TaxID=68285 RepID=UPI001673DD1A|nr:hypothetical protein [Streptomyces xantholiticus]